MYKTVEHSQYSFFDFNQSLGLHMNPENRWIKMADSIPWDAFEKSMPESSRAGPAMLPNLSVWLSVL